jgi:hypothetical protein
MAITTDTDKSSDLKDTDKSSAPIDTDAMHNRFSGLLDYKPQQDGLSDSLESDISQNRFSGLLDMQIEPIEPAGDFGPGETDIFPAGEYTGPYSRLTGQDKLLQGVLSDQTSIVDMLPRDIKYDYDRLIKMTEMPSETEDRIKLAIIYQRLYGIEPVITLNMTEELNKAVLGERMQAGAAVERIKSDLQKQRPGVDEPPSDISEPIETRGQAMEAGQTIEATPHEIAVPKNIRNSWNSHQPPLTEEEVQWMTPKELNAIHSQIKQIYDQIQANRRARRARQIPPTERGQERKTQNKFNSRVEADMKLIDKARGKWNRLKPDAREEKLEWIVTKRAQQAQLQSRTGYTGVSNLESTQGSNTAQTLINQRPTHQVLIDQAPHQSSLENNIVFEAFRRRSQNSQNPKREKPPQNLIEANLKYSPDLLDGDSLHEGMVKTAQIVTELTNVYDFAAKYFPEIANEYFIQNLEFIKEFITDEDMRKNLWKTYKYVNNPQKMLNENPNDPTIQYLADNPGVAQVISLWNIKLNDSRIEKIRELMGKTTEERMKDYQSQGVIETKEYFSKHKDVRDFMIGGGIFRVLINMEFTRAADRLQKEKNGEYKYKSDLKKERDRLIVLDKLYRLEELQERGVSLTATNIEFFANLAKDIGETALLNGLIGKLPTPKASVKGTIDHLREAVTRSAWEFIDIADKTIEEMTPQLEAGEKGEFKQTEEGMPFLDAFSKSILMKTGSKMIEGYGELFIDKTREFGLNKLAELDKLPGKHKLGSKLIAAGKITSELDEMLDAIRTKEISAGLLEDYTKEVLKEVFLFDDANREKNKDYFKTGDKELSDDEKWELFKKIIRATITENVVGRLPSKEDKKSGKNGLQSN